MAWHAAEPSARPDASETPQVFAGGMDDMLGRCAGGYPEAFPADRAHGETADERFTGAVRTQPGTPRARGDVWTTQATPAGHR
jgi:hypothetical protein